MAYILLYGTGWTQRWQIADGALSAVENEISRIGQDETGRVAIVDPSSGELATLVVSWRHVAAALVLGSTDSISAVDSDPAGLYRVSQSKPKPAVKVRIQGAYPESADDGMRSDLMFPIEDIRDWRGLDVVDPSGSTIGALEAVYFDTASEQPTFATVKVGMVGRHRLVFVPLAGATVAPKHLRVSADKKSVKDAPSIDMDGELRAEIEPAIFEHYGLVYQPGDSGERRPRKAVTPVLALLLIIWIVIGIIGLVVDGLFWLFVVACVLVILTILGAVFRRGRGSVRAPR